MIVCWALRAAKTQVTNKTALCLNTSCVDTDGGTQAAAALQTSCFFYAANGVWVGLGLAAQMQIILHNCKLDSGLKI